MRNSRIQFIHSLQRIAISQLKTIFI